MKQATWRYRTKLVQNPWAFLKATSLEHIISRFQHLKGYFYLRKKIHLLIWVIYRLQIYTPTMLKITGMYSKDWVSHSLCVCMCVVVCFLRQFRHKSLGFRVGLSKLIFFIFVLQLKQLVTAIRSLHLKNTKFSSVVYTTTITICRLISFKQAADLSLKTKGIKYFRSFTKNSR